ncbi:hypothetical protein PR048_019408, partial [Dryococelus australis]
MLQFVKRRLILAAERRSKQNKLSKIKSFPPGQLVLTRAINGPFEISRVVSKNCYELKDPTKGEIVGSFNSAALPAHVTPLIP